MGIFQNSGGGFSQIPLTLYILQEKLPQNGHKGQIGRRFPHGGREGGGRNSNISPFLLGVSFSGYWDCFCNVIIQSYRWGTWWRTIWRLRSTLLRLHPLPVESMLRADRRDWQMGLTLQRIPTNIVNQQLLETDKLGRKWNLLQSQILCCDLVLSSDIVINIDNKKGSVAMCDKKHPSSSPSQSSSRFVDFRV